MNYLAYLIWLEWLKNGGPLMARILSIVALLVGLVLAGRATAQQAAGCLRSRPCQSLIERTVIIAPLGVALREQVYCSAKIRVR